MNKSIFKTLFLAASAALLAGALIKFPQQALEASVRGVNMWWEIVFPSLLPFFIISELLISFGVVAFIGVMLEPLMRPLFKVPGVGGFIWAMGMASGFPSGAKLTTRLRQEKQLSKIEAERLISFTNSSNPLFIFGAVSIGFFHNPALGIVLAVAHYIANFFVGLSMRFYGQDNRRVSEKNRSLILKQALRKMHHTRLKEKRPFAKILGDSILSSIETLLQIGGFIILFSVINKLLYIINITEYISYIFRYILSLLQLSADFSLPFISGLFEITLGSQMISSVSNVPLLQQAILTSFILAFNGFSVHAQVASIIAPTDIRFAPYFFARILHGIFASIITIIVWKPLYENRKGQDTSTDAIAINAGEQNYFFSQLLEMIASIGPTVTLFALILYLWIYANRTLQK
ncbi:sporulation integral membrane protein YlbJ [Bacillus sp. AGMB 02131]|uniref:Sporulation integral membrane protein YlbJ n=1 Tax=Peribacillus faecalis TaxID=2772559 RepID=A0A927CUA8_9BACI|nr:sporulation integral membrane protein YlbJ [Peribacillus faecalis]MBD3106842.1 sporulation integral membrane protein YlbJ [Peribacillus faecalis]